MINATFRPIDRWPDPDGLTPSRKRKRSPFHQATWESTLELLDHELKMHGAKAVVISLALTDREIRRDGWPRRDARPAHPGVILEYDDPAEGWTTFYADQFDNWQHNVRAVARTRRPPAYTALSTIMDESVYKLRDDLGRCSSPSIALGERRRCSRTSPARTVGDLAAMPGTHEPTKLDG